MAIGINTIVLIVLGIIVLAVMIYVILTVSKTETVDCNKYKADFSYYCNICYNSKCSYYRIKDYNPNLCKFLNKCNVACDENKNPTCQDLVLQCQSIGIDFAGYCP
ncbi:MAG: hypothetical protein QW228_09560 [Candidatus Aenigmatarchaeota archaeon]